MTNFMIAEPLLWEKIFETHGCTAGVYKLRSLMPAPDHHRYIAISRIAGADENGVLYIGASDRLENRLATLKKAVCSAFGFTWNSAGAHATGKCFSKYKVLRDRFPLSGLCVTVEAVTQPPDVPVDFFALENAAIDRYASQFGEAPPMNSMGRVGLVLI